MKSTKKTLQQSSLSSQKGMVLLISLIFLLVLSVLAISAVEQTTLQTRMVANQWDRAIAFEVAERTLLLAEQTLENSNWKSTDFSNSGNNGLWLPESVSATQNWQKSGVWTNNQTVAIPLADLDLTVIDAQISIASSPRYMIELLKTLSSGSVFRVTARAVGAGHSVVVLQSTYVK